MITTAFAAAIFSTSLSNVPKRRPVGHGFFSLERTLPLFTLHCRRWLYLGLFFAKRAVTNKPLFRLRTKARIRVLKARLKKGHFSSPLFSALRKFCLVYVQYLGLLSVIAYGW